MVRNWGKCGSLEAEIDKKRKCLGYKPPEGAQVPQPTQGSHRGSGPRVVSIPQKEAGIQLQKQNRVTWSSQKN